MPESETKQGDQKSPPSLPSLIGQVLSNTYRVEGLLGKGGMGAVYVASHLRLPTKVAVKVLHAEAASNPEIFARFRREAEITSGLRHPNIVQVFDFNHLPDGTPYLVMECLEGEDLHQRLRQRGRMPYDEVVALARAIGGGLMAAHKKQVVHRDLKPQNIFLARTEQGDEVIEVPKIVDFGISKIRHASPDTQRTQDQQLLGTPNYMSPEQARGNNQEVDPRTDQWALAAILYQCLTGRLAFSGDSLAGIIYQVVLSEPPDLFDLCPEAPACAETAIRRALSKNREDRFASVLDFVRAFSGQPLVGQKSQTSQGAPGDHPETPTPGRRATAEFPGSSLPSADPRTPAPAQSGPVPLTPPAGSLGLASGQMAGPGHRGAVRYGVAAFVVVAALLGGAKAVSRWSAAPQKKPEPVSAPQEVTLRINPVPADALVTVGGRPAPSGGLVRLPRGDRGVEVVVSAEGFVQKRLFVVPSFDQTVAVSLDAVPAVPDQDKNKEEQKNVTVEGRPEPPPPPLTPTTDDEHRRHDKNKSHRRPHDDAEDVDINLGPSR